MITHADLREAFGATLLAPVLPELAAVAERAWRDTAHGDRARWDQALALLPELTPGTINISDTVSACAPEAWTAGQAQELAALLKSFIPWRKGPFHLLGVDVRTEWRSDWKWRRLQDAISPLQGRLVLDVGCGNAYHCYRMLEDGAQAVLGIDPYLLFHYQFRVVQKYMNCRGIHHLPLPLESMPAPAAAFDSVFSMGVLYHRREPLEHLRTLHAWLRPGGELVLETLIAPGPERITITKGARYARMRNVWTLPTVDDTSDWLLACGYDNISLADITTTSTDEQCTTEWMPFESLREALDPDNPALTVEGHPAPVRAVFTAVKP